MYELPPILQGSERQQLAALRDYLVRLARSLETASEAGTAPAASSSAGRAPVSAAPASARSEAGELRSLIVKTAHTIRQNVERLSEELHEDYLALSDFGSYREVVDTQIEASARAIVESYGFEALLQALDGRLGAAESAATAIRGEIRRGLITDPETGETVTGIAIAEELRFTGAEHSENGLVYYELSPGQTLGLYTATGWQFWINGSKRGWFDSRDGMLHVANLAVENGLRLGADWLLTATGGFGLRWMGG